MNLVSRLKFRSAILVRHRAFGITDRIMDFANKSAENNREKQFKEMVEGMASAKDWTLRSWKAVIDKQLNSWVMYIPGMSSSNEMKSVKTFKSILDAMTSAELDNPALVNGPARERIAVQSAQPVDDVAKMLFYYKHTRIIANWLQLKKTAGEKLPETEVEMTAMQEEDPRVKKIATQFTTRKRSGRGKRNPF